MSGDGKRTLDPLAKRKAVLLAGETLFARKGYTGTTMADIARAANVAVGTVYRLFPDKPALLAALHRQMEERFIDAMQAGWRETGDFDQKFAAMIDAIMDAAEAVLPRMPLYSLTRDMVGAADFVPGEQMMAAIALQYADGVEAGAFHPHPPEVAASIAHGMVDGAMRAWMTDPTPARKADVASTLKTLFDRAFLLRG
ncbi:MAG: TetR/AcrR family transcriptional regulator [Pseudomonadota bacterium]